MKIKEIEKDYNVNFNANPNMKLSTWLKRKGLKSLGKALDLVDKKISQ